MQNFQSYCESVARHKSPLGLVANNIEMWRNLATISNAAPQEMAALLQVPAATVAKWHGILTQAIKQQEALTKQEKKTEMLPTG